MEAGISPHAAVKRIIVSILLLAVLAAAHIAWSADAGRRVWIGTYTEGTKSKGIYTAVFDEQTGAMPALTVAAATPNPSFLALHPNGKYLYAVNETHDGPEHSGLVTAYAIDAATGALTELNHQRSRGADPCHLAIDATGRFLVVANYSSGSFVEFPIGQDGTLGAAMAVLTHQGSGPNHDRQEGPHAHDVVFDKDNRHLIAVDLGLDQVFVYTFDPASGDLKPAPQPSAATAPGAGPRHFAFHPGGRIAFSINELSSTITLVHVERAHRRAHPGRERLDAAGKFSRDEQHRRDRGRRRRRVRLRIEPRARQHCRVRRNAFGRAVAGRRHANGGQDAAELHDRPDRPLARRRQPGVQHADGLPP